jgi:hypothetical protein
MRSREVKVSLTAINDVTKALARLIESQLQRQVAAAAVTLLPPGETLPEQTGVNLYLYRVAQAAHTGNEPWRGDRVRPPTGRPVLGLDLHYLLTPLGKTSDANPTIGDVAHTMLGVAMSTLFENPVLNQVHLADFDADAELSPALLNSYEKVRITLTPAGVEDLSKVWASIDKPYRLSVAYEVSLVELVPPAATPVGGGLVLAPAVEVSPITRPRIDALTPARGPLAEFAGGVTARTLLIGGAGLGGAGGIPTVRIGGERVDLVNPPQAPFTALAVRLPSNLTTGPIADVDVRLGGADSNTARFDVTPWLAAIAPVRTALDSALPDDSVLRVVGPGLAEPAQLRIDGPGNPAPQNLTVADGVATAPIPAGLGNGSYSIRLQLPGGELSNALTLLVVPRLAATVTLTLVATPDGLRHRLVFTGARLSGDASVVIDGTGYDLSTTGTDTSLTVQLNRRLDPGDHSMAVVIDGVRSRSITVAVP